MLECRTCLLVDLDSGSVSLNPNNLTYQLAMSDSALDSQKGVITENVSKENHGQTVKCAGSHLPARTWRNRSCSRPRRQGRTRRRWSPVRFQNHPDEP